MKSTRITIWVMLVLLNVTGIAKAATYFNDGTTHTIFHPIELNVNIWDNLLGNPTTVNLISGGSVGAYLYVYNNSLLNVSGGRIGANLTAINNSQVNVYAGRITHNLQANHSSQIHMYGGSVIGNLEAWNSSQVTMSGGSVEYMLCAGYWDDCESSLTILGDNFEINGNPVNYGEYFASDFSSGHITGTLLNGDVLDNDFIIKGKSSIVLTPEVIISNESPEANAGYDIIADANEIAILNASASYDTDGDIVQYTWTVLPENIVLYSGQDSNFPTRTLGRVEEVIKLTVTDNRGASSEDFVSIFNRRVEDIELTPGPQGEQGSIGPQGLQGPVGEQGPPGITPAQVTQMQTQMTALQQANDALLLQVQALEQQNALLQKAINDNRYLLEQLPQLKKKLDELEAAVEEETP